jgi:hypothetical protein
LAGSTPAGKFIIFVNIGGHGLEHEIIRQSSKAPHDFGGERHVLAPRHGRNVRLRRQSFGDLVATSFLLAGLSMVTVGCCFFSMVCSCNT